MASFLPHIAEQAFVDSYRPYCKALTDQTPALLQNGEETYSDRRATRRVAINPAINGAVSINVGPNRDVVQTHKTAPAGY
jgi:hypothetical protein